ncbi:MAG: hypothetical protein PVI15_10600 [Chromatiales bacterium]|jgi:hypothetical protein
MAPPKRYTVVDVPTLLGLLDLPNVARLQETRSHWIAEELKAGAFGREPAWSESLAVGSEGFVEDVQRQLGARTRHREVISTREAHCLREPSGAYSVDFRT